MLLGMPEEVQALFARMVPCPGRLGKPADFAELVLHMAGNTCLNGEIIRLDRAIRMGVK